MKTQCNIAIYRFLIETPLHVIIVVAFVLMKLECCETIFLFNKIFKLDVEKKVSRD